MRLYHVSIATLVIRFFLITAIIVTSGFLALYFGSAFWYLMVLAFPVFVSCLLGIEFDRPRFLDKLEFWHHRTGHEEHGRFVH